MADRKKGSILLVKPLQNNRMQAKMFLLALFGLLLALATAYAELDNNGRELLEGSWKKPRKFKSSAKAGVGHYKPKGSVHQIHHKFHKFNKCHYVHCDTSNKCYPEKCNPHTGKCEVHPVRCYSKNKCYPKKCDRHTGKCKVHPVKCKQPHHWCKHAKCNPHTGDCEIHKKHWCFKKKKYYKYW